MSATALLVSEDTQILRHNFTDAHLESAAVEATFAYTYQTSAYYSCCS
jgi:hypothetical protein